MMHNLTATSVGLTRKTCKPYTTQTHVILRSHEAMKDESEDEANDDIQTMKVYVHI